MKQLNKIKIVGEKEKINLLFTDYTEDNHMLTHEITGDELAQPELYTAMDAMNQYVLQILDLPDSFINRIHPYAVSFRRNGKDGDQMAAVISAKFDVPAGETQIAINTPVKKYPEDEVDNQDPVHFFTPNAVKALNELESQAMAYINGKRAQMSLFEGHDDEDEEHETEAREAADNDSIIPFSASL